MDRLGDTAGQPGDDAPRYALSHEDRQHVTLENIELLAELDNLATIDAATETATEAVAPTPTPTPTETARPPVAWVVAAANPATIPTAPTRQPGAHARTARALWARPADRWLLEVLAIAGASGAFVAPSAWLAGLVAVCLVAGVRAFLMSGRSPRLLPARVARRSLGLLHPRSLIWVPVLTARTVIAAIVLPASVAVVIWLVDAGGGTGYHGVVAAARLGAWADGFRVAVALVCVMLLTSVGDGRERRATAVHRWATRLSDRSLVALAVACLGVATVAVAALPHPTDSLASGADGLAWLPGPVRGQADRVRDDIVTAELDAVASCLSRHTDTDWRTSYSVDNPLGDPDVAHLVANRDGSTSTPSSATPHGLATAILATHNLLAPWVETIEVRWAQSDLVRTDRDELSRRAPLTDADQLAPATSTGRHLLDAESADRATTLRCSASAVL
ncbi:MAG: hypothetical protein ACRD2C_12165 [Acidimicrobiales bacterium]